MQNLPLLPGYRFEDPTIEDYKLKSKFGFLNGYRILRDSNIGFGGRPIDTASSAYIRALDPVQYDPSLTYGRVREYEYQQFVPHYVLFAQKCLCFKAFFRQGVFNSPNEHFRIRYVNIIYFLEDDTICIIEPVVDNAGFQQGKLVTRDKIPKNESGEMYHWTDLNVGTDICIYGVTYHIVDCDGFTRQFLTRQGVDVEDTEKLPIDPYTNLRERKNKIFSCITKSSNDDRRRYLEYDKMILCFTATWNEDVYNILYFLTDDTIAIREIQQINCGKDPIPLLLKRMKVPKDWKNLPSTYPGLYLEYGDPEITEYYTPKDFCVGKEVLIFGRRFFLHDCDQFTRKYYSGMMGLNQADAIPLPADKCSEPLPDIESKKPDVNYATCLPFMPEQPKKNLIRQLANFPKKLRYLAILDAVHPEDRDRDFILEYNLSEGTILVTELQKRNSGRREGTFLKSTLIPKPNTRKDNPEYYTPEDFFLGARINIFNHYFIITGADLFVYRYIEANPEKFPQIVRNNMRDYFAQKNLLRNEITDETKRIMEIENAECKLARITQEDIIRNDCGQKFCLNASPPNYQCERGESRCLAECSAGMKELSNKSLKKEVKWSSEN